MRVGYEEHTFIYIIKLTITSQQNSTKPAFSIAQTSTFKDPLAYCYLPGDATGQQRQERERGGDTGREELNRNREVERGGCMGKRKE
jgi:hypothetical protein